MKYKSKQNKWSTDINKLVKNELKIHNISKITAISTWKDV